MPKAWRWCCLLCAALAVTAESAPSTRPVPGLSQGSTHGPAHGSSKNRTSADWLSGAVDAWEIAATSSDRPPSPLLLIAVGQGNGNDVRLPRTMAMLQTEAASSETVAGRVFGDLRVAMLFHAQGDTNHRNALVAEAMRLALQIDSETLRPIVDLELIAALGRTGQFRAAESIARSTSDVKARAAQYCALALAATERNEDSLRREYLRMVRRLIVGQDDETSGAILCKVGLVQAAMNDYRAARLTADSIVAPLSQLELFGELARRQRRANDTPGYLDSLRCARELVPRLSDESRYPALLAMARLQAELGDTRGTNEVITTARMQAEALRDPAERREQLLDLAMIAARAGDGAGCGDLLAAADAAVANLATDTSKPGHPTTGPERANLGHGKAIDAIAILARAGQVDTAEGLARNYRDPVDMALLDWPLAEAYARRGHFSNAMTRFDRLTSTATRAWAARRMAEALVTHAQFEALDDFLAGLSPGERAWAELGAAEGLIGHPITDLRNAEFCQLSID